MNICTCIAISCQPIAKKAKKVISDNLRGLWTNAHMFDVLEKSIKSIHEREAWNEGWLAIRGILRYDSSCFKEDILDRLRKLEKLIKPSDLLERARTFALLDEHRTFDLEDDIDDTKDASEGWRRVQDTTYRIGVQVAQDAQVLTALLPELVSKHNTRLYSFGRGLADGCSNKQVLWQVFRDQVEKTPTEKRQIGVIQGFLSACAESDSLFYNSTLDNLINDDLLGVWFPIFQTTSTIDKRGVERLKKALDNGKANILDFQYIAYGRAHESISDDDLADILGKIIIKEQGIRVAIEIMTMRFHRPEAEYRKYSSNLIKVGRDVLTMYSFSGKRGNRGDRDYALAQIANTCLNGQESFKAATEICQHFAAAIADNRIYTSDYPDLLNIIARDQPFVFLNTFIENDEIRGYQRRAIFTDDFERRKNPLDQISDEDILSWCDKDPQKRYPLITSSIQTYTKSTEANGLAWRPIIYSIFEKAPDLGVIFENLADSMRPTAWSGSLADILQKRSVLFYDLIQHGNAEICAWAKGQYAALQETIKKERECEENYYREQDASFE